MEATKTIKAGDMVRIKRSTGNQKARVMAIAEGWALLRFKGCVPFVAHTDALELPGSAEAPDAR